MRGRGFFALFVLVVFAQVGLVNGATVRLNEIVASNSFSGNDADGDNEDWIELHNFGSSPVNLLGWSLSDDYARPRRWVFPNVTIQAGGYLVVWASNKNRTQGELHTDFAISSSGEEIILVNQQGVIVDSLPPTALISDVSIGRRGTDNRAWHYFTTPTLGRENAGAFYQGIVRPPVFSRQGGMHNSGFDLTLSSNEPGVSIYYTTDGSEPDRNNTGGSAYDFSRHGSYNSTIRQRSYITRQYTTSIPVADRTGHSDPQHLIATHWEQAPVEPRQPPLIGTVVRARAYRDGFIPSEIVTHTYLITSNRYPVPVISIVLPEKYFFCFNSGIYVPGREFRNWRQNNLQYREWWEIPGNSPANFNMRGDAWEREANVELFEPNGNLGFNHRAGVRIHGGWSRSFPQKSLRLYARGMYGTNEFNYRFFPDRDDSIFQRILLRNSGNDYNLTFFRDALIHQMIQHRPITSQDWQPAVTFINGEYWGILNIRDRIDRHHLHHRYGVDPDNLDIMEASPDDSSYAAAEGDNIHFTQMFNYIMSNNMNDPVHFAHVETMMDVGSFAEHFAINIYVNNRDWPNNNMMFWRLRTDRYLPNAPYGHDGRWRWVIFDTDFGFGIWNSGAWINTLRHATGEEPHAHGNPRWSTAMFRRMLESQEFRYILINRLADLMNTSFVPDSVSMRINEMRAVYEPIINDHIDRWNRIESRARWLEEIEVMRTFANERPAQVRSHVQSYFGLSGNSRITVNAGTGNGTIRINTIRFRNSQGWQGRYFNGVPIEIEAIPDVNYSFSHWEGAVNSQEELIEVVLSGGAITLTAHFVEDTINPMVHYWHFNNLGTGELSSVAADFSATGSGRITYAGSSQGYLDRIDGDLNNYRLSAVAGYGLRARNPSIGRSLVIEAPTTGFEHIVFSYATRRTANGSQRQRVSYSTDGGSSWVVLGESIEVNEEYGVRVFDLRNIPAVNNNSRLRFRIEFTGQNASLTEGNNRFDNIAVESLDPSISVIDIITSVQERLSSSWRVSLGPNPISDNLIVVIDNPNEEYIGESVEVVVRDLRGRVKKTATIDIEGVGENISSMIDVSLLDSGIYIVDLYKNGNRIRRMDFTKIKRD